MNKIVIIKHRRRGLIPIEAEKWKRSKDHYIRDGWTLANESDAEKYMTKNFDEEE